MLNALLSGEVFSVLLVFTRVAGALTVLPGIGDSYVPPRVRLVLALATAVLVTPALAPRLPGLPASPPALAVLLFGEILIGLFLGLIARLLLTALDIAGTIIAMNLGLAAASMFNPAMMTQGSLVGALLTMLGLLLVFLTDLHHLFLLAIVGSYDLWLPGVLPPIGDITDVIARLVARSFLIAIELSAPILMVNMIFQLGLGLLARLMPAIQVFFIAVPVQVVVGVLLVALTLSSMMMFWLRGFQDALIGILRPA